MFTPRQDVGHIFQIGGHEGQGGQFGQASGDMSQSSLKTVFTPTQRPEGSPSMTDESRFLAQLEKNLQEMETLATIISNNLDKVPKKTDINEHRRVAWLQQYKKNKPTWSKVKKTFEHLSNMN
jgi:hypothetical protein